MERVSPVVTQRVGVPAETRTQVFCRLVQAAFPSVLPLLSSPKQSEAVSKHLLCTVHMSMFGPTLWLQLIGVPPPFRLESDLLGLNPSPTN